MKATRPAVLVLYVASRLFVIAAAAAALFSGQLYTAGQCLLTLFFSNTFHFLFNLFIQVADLIFLRFNQTVK